MLLIPQCSDNKTSILKEKVKVLWHISFYYKYCLPFTHPPPSCIGGHVWELCRSGKLTEEMKVLK